MHVEEQEAVGSKSDDEAGAHDHSPSGQVSVLLYMKFTFPVSVLALHDFEPFDACLFFATQFLLIFSLGIF